MATVVEFPRKLEWTSSEAWFGCVKGTQLVAKVEKVFGKDEFSWVAWNGMNAIGMGTVKTAEAARDAAKTCMEDAVVVLRPLPVSFGG